MKEFGSKDGVCPERTLSWIIHSSCFQNEEIFVELDEFYRITHEWIGYNFSLTQAQKTL